MSSSRHAFFLNSNFIFILFFFFFFVINTSFFFLNTTYQVVLNHFKIFFRSKFYQLYFLSFITQKIFL
ncbi:hypothetical protein GLOIN_2v1837064 [Rhizophagus irregularis DAOM 181602=DAOM 197198]|nr:hypothetical protein GLOIN_2v1837064 [Rhizophagus irregularis DAOM 181602=DAOM 197198]